MWRSDSSVSSRTGCPPDIVNEEDLTVGESEYPDFKRWNIPKVSTKSVYDLNWTEKSIFSEYRARTVEQTFSISRTHEKCCLFSKKNINEFLSKENLKYLHIGLVQVAVKPLTRKGIDASVLMCLRDARFKKFNDSILGMITASLYDGPVYFDCYPDLALALDDPNIIKALTLNILTSGYDMDDGSRPFTLIYRIFYRLLDSQLTPRSRGRDPAGKTMLIQCSTSDAKIQVPKMIQWQDVTLPKEWTLEQVAPPIKPPYWKEKFIDGLPPIFAHKVKNELIGKNDSIDFDNLTYGDIFSTIKKIGINMCNDEKWLKQQLNDKKKAKYEMGNFCEQYGLPPIAPSRQKGKSKHDKVYKSYSHKKYKRHRTHFVKPNDFYAKNKSTFRKHDKQRSGKGKCFNCGKFGHFSKDCTQKPGKLKNKLNMLNINNSDQNELFQILESAASTDSFEEDFSSSSDSNYHSRSDVSKSPNIKLGCRDSCCNVIKSVKMLTKSKENDDLLLTMISKIEDPNLQKDYLDKFLKNLTKEDKVKRPNSTISIEETLKRFNKNKSKEITVNDLQHEIKTVKQEIIQLKNDVKTIKHDNDHLKQELLILKIDKTMDKHQSDDDEQKDGDESDQQVSPSGNVSDRTLINGGRRQRRRRKHNR
ncbi:hypothetical protein ACB092_01G295400 [Castanea dentata]